MSVLSARCLSEREALEKLLNFLAPIAFGLGKPVLATYSRTTIRTLAKAIAKWQLGYTLLAAVEHFILLEQPPPLAPQLSAEQLQEADSLDQFLRSHVPILPPKNSWPSCDVIAMVLFLGTGHPKIKLFFIDVFLKTADPHSFFADSDPAVFSMQIRIQLKNYLMMSFLYLKKTKRSLKSKKKTRSWSKFTSKILNKIISYRYQFFPPGSGSTALVFLF